MLVSSARLPLRREWAQTLAFDEALNKPLRMDDLLGAYPSALYLGLQPCVVLLQIDHAVDHLFFIFGPGRISVDELLRRRKKV